MSDPHPETSTGDPTGATLAPGGSGPPDWGRIDFDPECPRCGYNLRGLERARCPECGLQFDWAVLIQRHVDRGAFLIEHAWRRRPLRSFAETAWRALFPWRFWRIVQIEESVCVPALLAFAALSFVLFLVVLHGLALAMVVMVRIVNYSAGNPWPTIAWSWQHPALFQLHLLGRWPLLGDWRYLLLSLGVACWSIGIALILGVCQQTLGRCRVRKMQIMRVVSYVMPPIYLWLIVVFHLIALALPRRMFFGFVPIALVDRELMRLGILEWSVTLFCALSTFSLQAICLALALERYLKLDRPWRVGIVATFVAALFSYTMVVCASVAIAG
jgi:hypothetical protein